MPMYDRICRCGWVGVDCLEPIQTLDPPCPSCSQPTRRAWVTKPPAAIGDEMDHVQVNGLKEPRRFRSKQERKRWLKETGWREADYHCPTPGSDKGKYTTSWSTGGTQWLRDAEILATRNGTAKGNGADPSDDFHVQWSEGTLPASAVERYRH